MTRTRHAIAVALVATALCADRVAAAAPAQPRVQGSSMAGRLVSSLSERFQRAMPTVRLYEHRHDGGSIAIAPVMPIVSLHPAHQPLNPFQFRLPPPVL